MKISYGRRFVAASPTPSRARPNKPLVAFAGDHAHECGTEPGSWFHLQTTSLMLRFILMKAVKSAKPKIDPDCVKTIFVIFKVGKIE